jgi:voltage-gated potassium channel
MSTLQQPQEETVKNQGMPTPHYTARVATALSALVFLIIVGMVGFRHFEGWNWTQSFYFTVSTLATIGYGDLHPTTDASRLFTSFYILAGVGVAVTSLGILGTAYLEQRTQNMLKRSYRK